VTSRWSAADRLQLVTELAHRAGAESEALFDAHGLGSAYREPGQGSSKKSRINSGLFAAEQRGEVDALLDAVRAFVGIPSTEDGRAVPPAAILPIPTSAEQHKLLQTVWDLFFAGLSWPTFEAVDRRFDRDVGQDLVQVAATLPAGMLQPPDLMGAQPSQALRLTVVGAAACQGSEEDLAAFLAAIRLATST
jgi:hypothetical protein